MALLVVLPVGVRPEQAQEQVRSPARGGLAAAAVAAAGLHSCRCRASGALLELV